MVLIALQCFNPRFAPESEAIPHACPSVVCQAFQSALRSGERSDTGSIATFIGRPGFNPRFAPESEAIHSMPPAL